MSNFTANNVIFGYKFNKLSFTVPTPLVYDDVGGVPLDFTGVSRTSNAGLIQDFTITGHGLQVGDRFNAINNGATDRGQPFEVIAVVDANTVTAELYSDSSITIDTTNLDLRLWGRYFIVNTSFSYGIAYNNDLFRFLSTENQVLTVNWGDGTVTEYQLTANAPFLLPRRAKVYTDGLDEHLIIFTFQKAEAITEIQTNRVNTGAIIPEDLKKFTNLETLDIGIGSEQFPEDLSSLTKLTRLTISDANLIKIDNSIGTLPLKELDLSFSLDFRNTTAENSLDIIVQLAEIETLDLKGTYLTEFPVDFVNRTQLKTLVLGWQQDYNILPANIPTSVTHLDLKRKTPDFINYNNFDRLINLERIDTRDGEVIGRLPIPDDFSALTKLKEYSDSNLSPTDANTFVNNWYDFFLNRVTGTYNPGFADITGANPEFRDMDISLNINGGTLNGTYQAPVGFSKGVSNGTPANEFEEVYVMVENLNHTWTINGTTYTPTP